MLVFADIRAPAGTAIFTGGLALGGGPVEDNLLDDFSGLAPKLSATLETREYVTIGGCRVGHVSLRSADGTTTDVFVVPGKAVHAVLSFTIPESLVADEKTAVSRSVEATALSSPAS